jgi:hypothetical protein
MSTQDELKRAFDELVPKNTDKKGSPAWNAVAKGLTELGLTTLHGKPWTRANAQTFWSRLQRRPVRTREEIPKTREQTPRAELGTTRDQKYREEVGTPSATGIISVDQYQLSTGEIITREQWEAFMLELWEAHKAGRFAAALDQQPIGIARDTTLAQMPAIVVPKEGTSININFELRELLKVKVQDDPEYPHREGYSFTKIFTWLAWRYMGCPDETFPKGKDKPKDWPPDDQADEKNEPEEA